MRSPFPSEQNGALLSSGAMGSWEQHRGAALLQMPRLTASLPRGGSLPAVLCVWAPSFCVDASHRALAEMG